MAQRIRTLAALPEEPGSIPSTHIVTHNHLLTPVSDTRHTHGTDIHAHKTHSCKIEIKAKNTLKDEICVKSCNGP